MTIACIAILSASPVPCLHLDALDRRASNEGGISSDEIIDLHAALEKVTSLGALAEASERSTSGINR